MKKNPPRSINAFGVYPRGTSFVYVFCAVDSRYGLFNFSFSSRKSVAHEVLKRYMDEAMRLIRKDHWGSSGLDRWLLAMERRGFRKIPSTATVLAAEDPWPPKGKRPKTAVTVLDCMSPPA